MNRVLWKFLAESAGKNIRVAFEHQLDPALDYIEIGGDSDNAISFDDYLAMEPPQNDSAGKLSVASSVGDLSVATEKEVPTEENEVPEIED